MAKMSSFEQHLAAAVSHCGLVDSGVSALILSAYCVSYFEFFPFGLESGLKQGVCLPLLPRGICLFFQSSCTEHGLPPLGKGQQGLEWAALLPVFCSAAAEAKRYLWFPPSLGFQRRITGEPKLSIFIQCHLNLILG